MRIFVFWAPDGYSRRVCSIYVYLCITHGILYHSKGLMYRLFLCDLCVRV